MMDHPNIAKVLDAGATDTGRPYFVMELVKGEAITEYCDKNNVGLEARLRLFQQACRAVQHAHQKGIIHRDIKPSNVMITLHDGEPVPKVIDFGIAKATSTRLTDKTVFTQYRQFMGTPEYMSPEQAEMSGMDVDTRSDVYSLGVLLYELLTGETPFDSETLRSASYDQIHRIIREQTPRKPSTHISTSGALSSIAAQRGTEPRKLGVLIRGDLDWIVMKALEKDRTRRYDTANDLAVDIQRYLDKEPVAAGPPSASYRVRKFVQRNKAGVAAATLVAAVLVLGVIGTSAGLAWALLEKGRADDEAARATAAAQAEAAARLEAQQAAVLAQAAEAEARARGDELEQVATFQAEQLSGIDVDMLGVRLYRDVLDEARQSWERIGLDDAAAESRMAQLAELLGGLDMTDLAVHVLDENIFDASLSAIDRKFAAQPVVKARLLYATAETMRTAGLWDSALAPHEEALAIRRAVLGNEHVDTLDSIDKVAFLLNFLERYEEARPLNVEVLETCRRGLGDDHELTLLAVNNMGWNLACRERYEEAGTLYREALEGRLRVLGEAHPETILSFNNVGTNLTARERYAEAESYLEQGLAAAREHLGDDHPYTLLLLSSLGDLCADRGMVDLARAYLTESLGGHRRVHGADHPRTIGALDGYGLMLSYNGLLDEAEPLHREAFESSVRLFGEEHVNTIRTRNNLALLYHNQENLEEAETQFRAALALARKQLGPKHIGTRTLVGNLALVLEDMDRLAEAAQLHGESFELYRAALGADDPQTLSSMVTYGGALVDLGRFGEAESVLRECLERRERVLGEAHWKTLNTMSLLGAAVLGQGRRSEAAPLLVRAAEQIEPPGDSRRFRNEAIERVVALYDNWHEAEPDGGFDARASAWRARLEAHGDDTD
jgi:tetratricopeptide (TPR) repeat protein